MKYINGREIRPGDIAIGFARWRGVGETEDSVDYRVVFPIMLLILVADNACIVFTERDQNAETILEKTTLCTEQHRIDKFRLLNVKDVFNAAAKLPIAD